MQKRVNSLSPVDIGTSLDANFGHAALVVSNHRFFQPTDIALGNFATKPLGFRNTESSVRVAHNVDVFSRLFARRLHASDQMRQSAISRAHPHLNGLEVSAVNKGLEFRNDLINRRPAAGRVGGIAILTAPTQEAPNRRIERFAENIPKRHVDAADRRDQMAPPS